MNIEYDILIIGGGAAGFFSAINTAEQNPTCKIAILERGKEVLTKVKISGGGRCNVTHAEFIPKDLSKNYPRGEKELLGPFHSFMTGDTIAWFQERGVELKIEEDGRMFPTSNSSQTIIDCFVSETKRLGIDVLKNTSVKNIVKTAEGFTLSTTSEVFCSKKLVVASGSNPKIWKLLENLGHTIIPPVPSLFTFNIKEESILDLQGITTEVTVEVLSEKGKVTLTSEGPLLITHWGMSGPAILKLSAWGARILEPTNYKFKIRVNWLEYFNLEDATEKLLELKRLNPKQTLQKYAQFDLPKRLWQNLLRAASIPETQTWADVTKKQLVKLSEMLTKSIFQVEGKSTFKEEFVTAGGVNLKEVNFKTFESKINSNLYFAGEVLNIDAITGGFNFQNAWTGGYIVAQSISN
ncbi:NAD(P)/FAD-dependent oxidoreductase [Patiriisocius hiemis]|uniref:NAD(P)/FAD-dependent oxidoreductase n=1 Tax=Patiriisocius hiemis TaxID=3075604 RepID=A0ABU2YDR7_9FLAO|nr:NAD(P)/FAD-dependent oxidoreductase [Constantimarinum sp. W242]MDT0556325.1 NAD(P)/FAD-dependent oxidoreductase [Constantimarinum sp. W242]